MSQSKQSKPSLRFKRTLLSSIIAIQVFNVSAQENEELKETKVKGSDVAVIEVMGTFSRNLQSVLNNLNLRM